MWRNLAGGRDELPSAGGDSPSWQLDINEFFGGFVCRMGCAVLGVLPVEIMKLGSGLCLFWGLISLRVFFQVCLPKIYFYKWYILFFNLHVSLISD